MRYVAYYRVSTAKQGASGLGLEAQQAAVLAHCQTEPIQSFTEVESGKRDDRPQLAAALAHAKANKATLVIAKLDRLARDVHFIAGLLKAKVDIVACDLPAANKFTLHIMAAVAEQEAEAISQRTKAALAAAKARGVRLGQNASVINAEARAGADAFARSLAPTIEELRCAGIYSVRGICSALNTRGIRTSRGAQWHPTSVQRLMDRLADHDIASLAQRLREYHPTPAEAVDPVVHDVTLSW